MTEHYVTLLDSSFLPCLIALHGSMKRHCGDFKLWILAMDKQLPEALAALGLTDITCIPLAEVEAAEPRLLVAKANRSRGEYCWTLTPFTYDAVWRRAPEAGRVTYLDADIFFFRGPANIFDEFSTTGRSVMITEHAFDARLEARGMKSGRFCVQFLPVQNSPDGRTVLTWWQDRCLEWCYNRLEADRFGDQKYLDRWPELFPETVHVLQRPEWTQAPWNRDRFAPAVPVIYHFQGFRLLTPERVILFYGGRVSPAHQDLYATYLREFLDAVARLTQAGIPVRIQDYNWLKRLKARLWLCPRGMAAFARIPAIQAQAGGHRLNPSDTRNPES